MKKKKHLERRGFTLLEILIVVAIVGSLAALAVPFFSRAWSRSHTTTCQRNRRIIFEALNTFCMDNAIDLIPTNWPDLCAARDTLAPGGASDYVRDWTVFECPITDAQDQHDYSYIWENGTMVGLRCNNGDPAIRNLHNQP